MSRQPKATPWVSRFHELRSPVGAGLPLSLCEKYDAEERESYAPSGLTFDGRRRSRAMP
jgi:hypothetical protein